MTILLSSSSHFFAAPRSFGDNGASDKKLPTRNASVGDTLNHSRNCLNIAAVAEQLALIP